MDERRVAGIERDTQSHRQGALKIRDIVTGHMGIAALGNTGLQTPKQPRSIEEFLGERQGRRIVAAEQR